MRGTKNTEVIHTLCICLWLPVYQAVCPYLTVPEITHANIDGYTRLLLGTNDITVIPAGRIISNLTELNLEDNPITTIDDTAFDASARTLTSLTFSNVRFSRIPDAFGHLYALAGLDISRANITDWNSHAWMNIGKTLQYLNLYDVGMTTWPMFLQYFTSLQELTIGITSISSIPDSGFDSLVNTLTSLSIDSSSLTMIPRAVSKLKSLQILVLEKNHISDLSWFPQNSKLFSVSLSNNYISNAVQLSQVLRPYEHSLATLGIEYNHLTSIPDFSYLSQTGVLDFTYNRISDPTSGTVPANLNVLLLSFNDLPMVPKLFSTSYSVTDIVLSNNVIKAIQETDFHNRTLSIDLSYNLITQLPDTSVPENFGLQYLYLGNNPLTYISPSVFQRLPDLTELDLSHSKLTRLPLALIDLRMLIIFDVSDSSDLVCTCMESSLRPWIMNHTEFQVEGNCGSTSVYYFYDKLSPLCPV